MRGWTSFIVGFLLLGVAYWWFTMAGFASATYIFAGLAIFFFICGAAGKEVSDEGGPTALIEFVTNPADAIVDSAADRLGDWLHEEKPKAAPEQAAVVPLPPPSKFQHGAALERYWEQRDAETAATPAFVPPQRGFGRKGA